MHAVRLEPAGGGGSGSGTCTARGRLVSRAKSEPRGRAALLAWAGRCAGVARRRLQPACAIGRRVRHAAATTSTTCWSPGHEAWAPSPCWPVGAAVRPSGRLALTVHSSEDAGECRDPPSWCIPGDASGLRRPLASTATCSDSSCSSRLRSRMSTTPVRCKLRVTRVDEPSQAPYTVLGWRVDDIAAMIAALRTPASSSSDTTWSRTRTGRGRRRVGPESRGSATPTATCFRSSRKRRAPGVAFDLALVNFDSPSEVRTFPMGRFELYPVGPMTFGRATYEPGWKWSEHVGASGGERCVRSSTSASCSAGRRSRTWTTAREGDARRRLLLRPARP